MKTYISKTVIYANLLFCFLCGFAHAQISHESLINDPDGYVNVRSAPDGKAPVLGTIKDGEFFYASDKGEWRKVLTLKFMDGIQLEGYVHSSRIIHLKDLPAARQKELLEEILYDYKSLVERYQMTSMDKLAERKALYEEISRMDLEKYNMILGILPVYFCRTADYFLLEQLLDTMWADRMSANEVPSLVLADCFKCRPEIVLKELEPYIGDSREYFIESIVHGLDDADPKLKEYLKMLDY